VRHYPCFYPLLPGSLSLRLIVPAQVRRPVPMPTLMIHGRGRTSRLKRARIIITRRLGHRILPPHLHLLRVHHISTPLSPPRCPVSEERRPGLHRPRISAVRDRLIERLRCVVARGTGHPNNPGGLCLIGRLTGARRGLILRRDCLHTRNLVSDVPPDR